VGYRTFNLITVLVLYEFSDWVKVERSEQLRSYLDETWKGRYLPSLAGMDEDLNDDGEEETIKSQRFLAFDGHMIRALNYVGFIQTKELHLELYPKVFRNVPYEPVLMLRHLFFWFDYCRRWKFPFTQSDLEGLEGISFPELLIHLMGLKMLETVASQPVSLFETMDEKLTSPKGRIDFAKYLSSGFINGKQHVIDCIHQPFVFDNKLNRVIKYCTRGLLHQAKFAETQRILEKLLFILDEVEDMPFTYRDLDQVVLNPLFSRYEDIKDICSLVLQQMMYSNKQYELSNWSLLFPMEYIFEDFIAGFIEKNFSSAWEVNYQQENLNLCDEPPAFKMRHDILLTLKSNSKIKVIVDTKYKIREAGFKKDNKRGVVQSDMYQMMSYAVRRGCTEVLLIYPNMDEHLNEHDAFVIKLGFNTKEEVNIKAVEVPFWSTKDFAGLSAFLEKTIGDILGDYKNTPRRSSYRLADR
jgi:5-methylcytosine-specific restriction enzyme subunit McrC